MGISGVIPIVVLNDYLVSSGIRGRGADHFTGPRAQYAGANWYSNILPIMALLFGWVCGILS